MESISLTRLLAHYSTYTGADLSRVDTSADDTRKDARAQINGLVEKLRGADLSVGSEGSEGSEGEGDPRSECLGALSAVAELCREEGAAGEANRMAVGEVWYDTYIGVGTKVVHVERG